MSTIPSPQSEELKPLHRSSSQNTDDEKPSRLRDVAVAKLRDELDEVQRKLEKALRLQPSSTSDLVYNKNAGHVDVDFVRTKPSKRGRMRCKKINVKTIILHSFHAEFPEGCVTALMGPSGAGKTTLLDFLTGMLGDSVHASGQVALPDDDAYVPQDDRLHGFYTCQMYMEHYARLTGMKPVFDCCASKKTIPDNSTTEGDAEEGGANDHRAATTDDFDENEASRRTRREKDDVDQRIAEIFNEVGLSDQANTVVGGMFKRGLSGGQKRRLSVALEALSSPLNLFLDEPTSGLDSESALGLMQYLHDYARGKDPITGRRRRVIVTIHQPSSQIWEAIDNVVLLAEGRLMYQGPRTEMNGFVSAYGHPVPVHYNPADHFIEVLFKMPDMTIDENRAGEMPENPKAPEMWSRCFKQWSNNEDERESLTDRTRQSLAGGKSVIIRKDPREGSSISTKVKVVTKKSSIGAIELTRRAFTNLIRNPVVLGLRFAIYAGMSLVIGILFFGLEEKNDIHSILISRTALLYFIIAFCSSMSVAVIPFAMIDRAIVQKEVRNHLYHPAFYHASQVLASIPVCLILSIAVTVIVLSMTGIRGSTQFGLILFLTFLCADAVSMFVSHISPELISAICISSGIFGIFTMVMGFLVTPSNFPKGTGWLYYVPFTTYSFRSLMHLEYSGLRFFNASEVLPGNSTIDESQIVDFISDNTGLTPNIDGNLILKQFEMNDVNVIHDMYVLIGWACIMHSISIVYLFWSNYKSRRTFVYSDE